MTFIRHCAILLALMHFACAGAAQPAAAPRPAAVPAAAPAQDEPIGRLFYTPAQRATLDELRRRPQAAVTEAEKPALPPPPEYVTLNGVVRRSDGATTVWLNDRQVRGRESEEGLQIAPQRRAAAPGNVTVRVPQTGAVVDLRVGQQLEVNSGEVKERYRAPPRPGPSAVGIETPASTTTPEAGSLRDRRAARERETLRELLREIESPAGTASSAQTPPPAAR